MSLKKLVTELVLCLISSALLTVNKVSLVWIVSWRHEYFWSWLAAVIIILLVPEFVGLAKQIWDSSFFIQHHRKIWPTWRAMLMGIFVSLAEGGGLTFFVLEVLSYLPGYLLIPLLQAILPLKIILDFFFTREKHYQLKDPDNNTKKNVKKQERCHKVFNMTSSVLVFLIFIVISTLSVLFGILRLSQSLALVACTCGLAVVWYPSVQTYILTADNPRSEKSQNAAIVYTLLRVCSCLTVVVATTVLHRQENFAETMLNLKYGFTALTESQILVIVCNCLTTVIAHLFVYISATVCASQAGITFASFISAPVATVLCLLNCLGIVDPWEFTVSICDKSDIVYILSGVAFLVWLQPYIAFRYQFAPDAAKLLKPMCANFIRYNYNSVLFDQYTHCNYSPMDVEMIESDRPGKSRIFICTTMYREADYEMARLLKSLQRVSMSDKMKHVHMESHIFLDNGSNEDILGEFALQLLSLTQTTLSLHRLDCIGEKTPYGYQLQWTLPGGMPLFLHFKDPTKVKPKKRWSQVSYMKYILEYRTNLSPVNIRDRRLKLSSLSTLDFALEEGNGDKNKKLLRDIRDFLHQLRDSDDDSMEDEESSYDDLDDKKRRNSFESSDQGIDTGGDMSSISLSSDSPTDSDNEHKKRKTEISSSGIKFYIEDDSKGSRKSSAFTNLSSEQDEKFDSAYTNAAFQPDSTCPSDDSSSSGYPGAKYLQPPPDSESTSEESSRCENDFRNRPIFSIDAKLSELKKGSGVNDNTYILATDADMDFDDDAVLEVLNTCNWDLRLGGCCGRTYPMGKRTGPIVWFQMFEYAKDFWMIKSAQNVIGSVMCCPGCFSLYRSTALRDVLQDYSSPTHHASEVFTKDTGEDRWMCTLMMMKGWKLKYTLAGRNTTYCPDTLTEFFKQRKRWVLSDLANTILVFRNIGRLANSNKSFTMVYILYLLQLLFIVLLAPGSTVVMLTLGLDLVFGIPYMAMTPLITLTLVTYALICCKMPSHVQTSIGTFLSFVFGIIASCVVVGACVFIAKDIIQDIEEKNLEYQEHYILLTLIGSLIYAAMLHPGEAWIIIHGIAYMFYFPTMHVLVPLYAICNIVDQSWGTRDGQKAKVPKFLCFPKLRRRKKKKKNKNSQSTASFSSCSVDSVLPHQRNDMQKRDERTFWTKLVETLIGNDVNLGLNREDLASGLNRLRFRAVTTVLVVNVTWIVALSIVIKAALIGSGGSSMLNIYGSAGGVIYGFALIVQMTGMTLNRLDDTFRCGARTIFGAGKPMYVTHRDSSKSK